MKTHLTVDIDEIHRVMQLHAEPGQVVEIRAPNVGGRKGRVMSGYYDDLKKLAQHAARLSGQCAGIYCTLNLVEPALLPWAANRLKDWAADTTAEDHILWRTRLLLDVDPIRPSGVSSTDEEHEWALQNLSLTTLWLTERFVWPAPLMTASSGNGGQGIYRIDLPNTPESTDLVRRVLSAISLFQDDEHVTVDTTVYKAAQLFKLYGTLAAKGDSTQDRPHRLSRLISTSPDTAVVSREQLEAVANLFPRQQSRGQGSPYSNGSFDLDEWLDRAGLEPGPEQSWKDGATRRVFDTCPFNPDHTDRSAFIVQLSNGAIAAGCHHNSCQGKGWPELKALYGAPRSVTDDRSMAAPQAGSSSSNTAPALDEILGQIREIGKVEDASTRLRQLRKKVAEPIGLLKPMMRLEVVDALISEISLTRNDAHRLWRECHKEMAERRNEGVQTREPLWPEGHSPDTGLPFIQGNDRQMRDIIDDARSAVDCENALRPRTPVLYAMSGQLARVVTLEEEHLATRHVRSGDLKETLSRVADWFVVKRTKSGESLCPVMPPSDVVRALRDGGAWIGLPTLHGIVTAPVFGADGRLHDQPGYEPSTKLYLARSVNLGDTEPSEERVDWAKNLYLADVLHDFPFKDSSSRAHAFALVLQPFVRQMIAGPTPLFLVEASTQGTGKGLLCMACTYPVLGYGIASAVLPQSDDEIRKHITTKLLEGKSFIFFDNIVQRFDSAAVASAITQPFWSDRILGGNTGAELPVQVTWLGSGNNVTPSMDMARRIVEIRLDANQERPWERPQDSFKHPNLFGWMQAHRDALVTAAIVLVRAWMAQGYPKFTARRRGSFEAWSEIIGGILQVIGIDGFLENDANFYETALDEHAAMPGFVRKWSDKFGTAAVGISELFTLASYPDGTTDPQVEWCGLLDDLLGDGNERSRRTKLGILLGNYRDRVIGNWKISRQPGRLRGETYYRLMAVLKTEGDPAPTVEPDSSVLPASGARGAPSTPEQILRGQLAHRLDRTGRDREASRNEPGQVGAPGAPGA